MMTAKSFAENLVTSSRPVWPRAGRNLYNIEQSVNKNLYLSYDNVSDSGKQENAQTETEEIRENATAKYEDVAGQNDLFDWAVIK